MLLLDAALRISAITMLLLMAVLALLNARHLLQGRLATALAISLSGMLINTMPDVMAPPSYVGFVAWLIHIPKFSTQQFVIPIFNPRQQFLGSQPASPSWRPHVVRVAFYLCPRSFKKRCSYLQIWSNS